MTEYSVADQVHYSEKILLLAMIAEYLALAQHDSFEKTLLTAVLAGYLAGT